MCLPIALFSLITLFVELRLFGIVGARLGFLGVLGWILLSGGIGSSLIQKARDLQTHLQSRMMAGAGLDQEAMSRSITVMLAGVLLLIPGFFTDALGGVILIPGVRQYLSSKLGRWFVEQMRNGVFQGNGSFGGTFGGGTFGKGPFGTYTSTKTTGDSSDDLRSTKFEQRAGKQRREERAKSSQQGSPEIIEVDGYIVDDD